MRTLAFATLLLATTAQAQFEIQDSHTTASLRGIHNVGGGAAWASGTEGTVLRTEDGGYVWQGCAVPPGAEHLDFRGIQAFDENTAIVMSSGKGDLSRLYKTTDGCRTWKLLFTNPDTEGFWDAIRFPNPKLGFILGDPVTVPIPHASPSTPPFTGFAILVTEDGGTHFRHWTFSGNQADPATHGAFAASNSALFVGWPFIYFGSGGTAGPRAYVNAFQQHISYPDGRIEIESGDWHSNSWSAPLAHGEAAGIFSIVFLKSEKADKEALDTSDMPTLHGVAVGGDYKKADSANGTAALTVDGGQHWNLAQTPPHGYRSAVAYDAPTKTWITVGPNGTDQPDADKNWNALSLPLVVGPKGRIGKLRGDALKP